MVDNGSHRKYIASQNNLLYLPRNSKSRWGTFFATVVKTVSRLLKAAVNLNSTHDLVLDSIVSVSFCLIDQSER